MCTLDNIPRYSSNFSVEVSFDTFTMDKWTRFVECIRTMEPVSVKIYFCGFRNLTRTLLPDMLMSLRNLDTRFYLYGFEMNQYLAEATNSSNIIVQPSLSMTIHRDTFRFGFWKTQFVEAISSRCPVFTVQFVGFHKLDPRVADLASMIDKKYTEFRAIYLS